MEYIAPTLRRGFSSDEELESSLPAITAVSRLTKLQHGIVKFRGVRERKRRKQEQGGTAESLDPTAPAFPADPPVSTPNFPPDSDSASQ